MKLDSIQDCEMKMNTAERILNRMDGEWFKVLVSQKYQFNRDVQQATEAEIREAGFDWEVVHTAFCWKNLEPDFIRQIVESDKTIKKELEHELIMDIHDYSIHASAFYQNMYIYLKLDLAEQKELKKYIERVGMMYMQQLNREQESRHTYSLIDHSGMVQDQIIL